jgi:hypothetical protein
VDVFASVNVPRRGVRGKCLWKRVDSTSPILRILCILTKRGVCRDIQQLIVVVGVLLFVTPILRCLSNRSRAARELREDMS